MSKTVDGVAMLAAPSTRSRVYFDVLERDGLLPETVLLLDGPVEMTDDHDSRSEDKSTESIPPSDSVFPEDPVLDISRSLGQPIVDANVEFQAFSTMDPHDGSVLSEIEQLDVDFVIYSGPGGVILESKLLEVGPPFLHVHSGSLPAYRGSTTIYYSLLQEGQCGVTAFIMNENIDEGPIVATDTYPPPENPEMIDHHYDPWIRAQLLVDVLIEYRETGSLSTRPQDPDAGETYYIVHPVLKHLAVLSPDEE